MSDYTGAASERELKHLAPRRRAERQVNTATGRQIRDRQRYLFFALRNDEVLC